MLYPIGIQDFGELRRNGFVYVDKTRFVHRLASTGKYYFLGRPRRFGKSLLLSTMEAYFLGRKELFKGLAIEELEQEWKEYPVLHLDLNVGRYDTPQALEEVLDNTLSAWERRYGIPAKTLSNGLRFSEVVQRAYERTGLPVVVLIDEYDKPLLQAITNAELQGQFRATLKAFYSVLKTMDRCIRFAFLTGVTKFGKVSIFSDLNNLKDISMNREYAEICGITEAEIHENFEDALHEMARSNGMTYEEACAELKRKYDGYHFEVGVPGVYNPFSLINALQDKAFKDYWFETGTPTFLVRLLEASDYDLNRLQGGQVMAPALSDIDNARSPIPMFYQSGYLTISGYDNDFGEYILDFPNAEVERGFITFILPNYLPNRAEEPSFSITQFVRDVRSGRAEDFMQRLTTFFDDCDYRVTGRMEVYFQNALYIVFKMMGFFVQVERATARGRIDVVVTTQDYVYVLECKLDKSAEEALRQIDDKGYALPYAADGRKLYKIGINFSSETRGISEYKIA